MRKSVIQQLFFSLILATAMVTSVNAFYTQCTVHKDIEPVNRPNGETVPRWPSLEKGEKVAIRSTYNSKTKSAATHEHKYYNWVFIYYFRPGEQWFGWVPANVLDNCQAMEGTP